MIRSDPESSHLHRSCSKLESEHIQSDVLRNPNTGMGTEERLTILYRISIALTYTPTCFRQFSENILGCFSLLLIWQTNG